MKRRAFESSEPALPRGASRRALTGGIAVPAGRSSVRGDRSGAPRIVLLLAAALLSALALAARGPTLQVATDIASGGYLVDAYGRTLYLFTNDAEGLSTCYEQCAINWPPYLVRNEPTVGEGVDAGLVGTVERDDGTTQLTYAGMPLYYFRQDAQVGQYFGQGLNERWYLVSPAGEAITELAAPEAPAEEQPAEEQPAEEQPAEEQPAEEQPAEEQPADDAAAAVDQEVYAQGQQIYREVCQACHGANGEGGVGVPLAGNANLADTAHVADIIVHGLGYMPPVGADQSNEWVAAAATYVRNTWGNAFGPVTPDEVESVR